MCSSSLSGLQEVLEVAQNILAFLKANCTMEGHTYWLFRRRGEDIVKLYDLTSLNCFEVSRNICAGPDKFFQQYFMNISLSASVWKALLTIGTFLWTLFLSPLPLSLSLTHTHRPGQRWVITRCVYHMKCEPMALTQSNLNTLVNFGQFAKSAETSGTINTHTHTHSHTLSPHTCIHKQTL